MKQYYIKKGERYFNSTIISGKALNEKLITEKDLVDAFFTKDPSQIKTFDSIEEAQHHLEWVSGCKIVEIIPNSGETSKIHKEV